jgi:hypothetical protein
MMGQNDRALELLQQVARSTPEDEFLWQYLVYTLWELGRLQDVDRVIREWEATHIGNTRLREFYQAARQGVVSFPSDVPSSSRLAPVPMIPAPGSLADSMTPAGGSGGDDGR